MRFGFVTAVQLGLSCMEAIYRVGGRLDFAMTLENNKAVDKSGRIFVDSFCDRHGIPLTKIRNINSEKSLDALLAAKLDWLFIIGWSQIAKTDVLSTAKNGVLGMHPTLLPVGRGRASVPWAILKGLKTTGVTLFKLNDGVDTGPVLLQREIPVADNMDATLLYELVQVAHADLMELAYPMLVSGSIAFRKQDENQASIWPSRRPDDGAIDLAGQVEDAERLVRAVTRPYPGAFVDFSDRRRVIWKARIARESEVTELPVISFLNGHLICIEWDDSLR
jgi:methionyl-tRNA formyltransferase